jgi:hypothetical protein
MVVSENSGSIGGTTSIVPGNAGSERKMIVMLLVVMVLSSAATLMVIHQPDDNETVVRMMDMMCERWGNASYARKIIGSDEGVIGGFFVSCIDKEVDVWNGSLFFGNGTMS